MNNVLISIIGLVIGAAFIVWLIIVARKQSGELGIRGGKK
jgi:hypothetical protein